MVAKKPAASAAAGAVGPEAEERKRLRSLAFSKGLLQRGEPAAPRAALPPSGAVARLQGRDIVRPRGQRRGRFLFSFPGLLAPAAAGGRVGELADLGTKNPVLYLEFPQGRMKLLGTHVYPKNKYLTLQMTRSAKGVACEDVFESMIVFPEAWWVGTKEENPDELKLEFPKEMQNVCAAEDVDFKGGAGAASGEVVTVNKPRKQAAEPHTPEYESDADSEDSDVKDEIGTQTTSDTPVRKSARTAGKTFKFAELAGGDSAESDTEIEFAEDLDEKMESAEIKEEIPGEDIKPEDPPAESLSIKKQPLVQANLSAMFKKAEEKKRPTTTRSPKGSPATKGPAAKKQRATPTKKQSPAKKEASGSQKKQKAKVPALQDDDMGEEEEDDDSDDDWAG
uniref:DNA-binding protein RHL1 n=1 Tax=Triticum aestivum TaxID=4565 RepID=A0A3B6TZS9_WHEAT